MKTCAKCRVSKNASGFNRNRQSRDGLQTYCKSCQRNYLRAWLRSDHGKALKSMQNQRHLARVRNRQREQENPVRLVRDTIAQLDWIFQSQAARAEWVKRSPYSVRREALSASR